MGRFLETPDGKMHEILDDAGILDLIREYAGVDAADYVEGRIEELKYDLQNAEETIEELEAGPVADPNELTDADCLKADLELCLVGLNSAKTQVESELEDIEAELEVLKKIIENL